MSGWKLRFGIIWSGQAVSIFSGTVLQFALIWHLTLSTGSALVLSLASIAGLIPQAVLSSFLGALVDRWNRKLVIIMANLLMALVALSVVIFDFSAELPVWFVMVALLVRSIGTAFHFPAINAVTPLIVPKDELTKSAGYTLTLQTLGMIGGASVAAIIYPIWGVGGMAVLDVLGATIASLAVLFVEIPSPPKCKSTSGDKKLSKDIKEGFGALRRSRGLFTLFWITVIFSVLFSPVNALFPLMSINHFGGTLFYASAVEVVFTIGMIAGGLLLGFWGGFKNRAYSIAASTALMGIATLVSGALPPSGFIVFVVMSLLMGFGASLYEGLEMAIIQQKIPPEFLGRVLGFLDSATSFSMILGLVISSLLADSVGVADWFLICGILMILLAIAAILLPSMRRIERE